MNFICIKPSDKALPPQARAIVDIIHSHGKVSRDTLLDEFAKLKLTRQPAARVVSFYRTVLVQSGYIELDDSEDAPSSSKPVRATGELSLVCSREPLTQPDSEPLTRPVMRAFRSGGEFTLLCGEDLDDHDVWHVADGKALLLGTLNKAAFNVLLTAKEFELGPEHFECCRTGFSHASITHTPMSTWSRASHPAFPADVDGVGQHKILYRAANANLTQWERVA